MPLARVLEMRMKVPFLDLKRQFEAIGDEIAAAIQRVLDSGWYILGKEVESFEAEWAAFCEARGAVGVACGTDALVLALKASGAVREGKNDEVITPTMTAGYTALAIQLAGGIPVLADIDPQTYSLDPQSVEDSITPRTRAIMPVHLHGRMADMPSLCYLAEKHGLMVVEDGSQAHGARLNDKSLGSYGVAAGFSLYPTKNLGGFGDGGALIAHDDAVLRKAKILRQGGHLEALQYSDTGINSRLDEMQAAILRVRLKQLRAWTARRQEIAGIYNRELSRVPSLRLPEVSDPESHVFHVYSVSHPRRDAFRDHLHRHGIETLVHFSYLLHEQPHFKQQRQVALPAAEKTRATIFSLPLHPWVREDEVAYVIEVMKNFDAV
jgi:dTDP-4-amino-4,6-dideoxygalactose transaminase